MPSQKLTAICMVGDTGHRLGRGQCESEPEPIERAVRGVREIMRAIAVFDKAVRTLAKNDRRADA